MVLLKVSESLFEITHLLSLSCFRDLAQPFRPMPGYVHLLARAGNRPAPIQILQAIHPPREILGDREVAAGQFSQSSHAVVTAPCRPPASSSSLARSGNSVSGLAWRLDRASGIGHGL